MYKESKYNLVTKERGRCFIFNTRTRSFVALSQLVWDCIRSGRYADIKDTDLNYLLKSGVIVQDEADEWQMLLDKMHSTTTQKNHLVVFLSMTSGCNLRCPYCYQDMRVSRKEKGYITVEALDRVIQFIKANPARSVSVVYFGGEPTLCESNLIYAIREINRIPDKTIRNSLITNGYHLTKNLIDVISSIPSFGVQITLDGNKETHNAVKITASGQPTFDAILSTIGSVVSRIPHQVFIRINISSENMNAYRELVDLLWERFGNRIEVAFEVIFDGQCQSHSCGASPTESLLNITDYARKKGYHTLPTLQNVPCVARMENALAVDEDLNVYSCPAMLYWKPAGRMSANSEIKITADQWYDDLQYFPPCMKGCLYAGLCGGGCIMKKGQCQKERFDRLAPYVISKKIENYFQRRTDL